MYNISMATYRYAVFIIIIIVQVCIIFYQKYSFPKSISSLEDVDIKGLLKEEEAIDLVYTWVNGSAERFLEQLNGANSERGSDVKADVNGKSRFAEKHELMYSLRSVEKNMPWIRHVYIVTNGQIPSWLNLHTDLVTIIPHENIFTNRSHLPTFNSRAIEANLYRIPGISKRFVYINDDWLIGAPVEYSTFYTPTDGQLFYWDFALHNCARKCPWSKIGNGHCDVHCYVPECQLDGGDCPEPPDVIQLNSKMKESAYHASLKTTQRLFNENFGFRVRHAMPHMPILIDKDVMQDAWKDFPLELSNTSSHHFRDHYDLQFEFFYAHYTLEKTTVVSLGETLREYDTNDDRILTNEEVDLMIIRHSQGKDEDSFRRTLEACTPNNKIDSKVFNLTLLVGCETLGLYLEKTLRSRFKYKSILITKVPSNGFHSYVSLQSNVKKVVGKLNELRKHPKKFICLNDDLNHESSTRETDARIYEELARFYQHMFPEPSRYELPEGDINPPGKYIQELTVN